MDIIKFILMGIGAIAIVLAVVFLIIGAKVVSVVLYYMVMAIAVVAIIGFVIYLWGKHSGKSSES